MGLLGPSFQSGMTACFTFQTLTCPETYPLKVFRKKLSELSFIQVISISLGLQMVFQCSACFTYNLGGIKLIVLTFPSPYFASQKFFYLVSQLMNLSAYFALQRSIIFPSLCLIYSSVLQKTIVGGLNSWHYSEIASSCSVFARPDSLKVKCQSKSYAQEVFINFQIQIKNDLNIRLISQQFINSYQSVVYNYQIWSFFTHLIFSPA